MTTITEAQAPATVSPVSPAVSPGFVTRVTSPEGDTSPRHPWSGIRKPTTPADAMEVGRKLLDMRDQMPGTFKAAFEDPSAPFTYRTAARLMEKARAAQQPQVDDDVTVDDDVPVTPVEPMESLAPTRFSTESTMTEEEIDQLAAIALDGIDVSGCEHVGLPRLAGSIAAAVELFPHARFGDLVMAANRARVDAMRRMFEIEALLELARAQPPDGIVSSSSFGAGSAA